MKRVRRDRNFSLLLTAILFACGHVVKGGDGGEECAGGLSWCDGECIDLSRDAANCGLCGRICRQPPHASGRCVEGNCVFECQEGWWDENGNLEDGCEYECTPSGEANDICNGADDDCDGLFEEDEGQDACRQGEQNIPCQSACGTTGTTDCDQYCMKGPCRPPAEECNGSDDDCDTIVDNGFPCAREEETSCTTVCGSRGTGVCSSACTLPAPASCNPPQETCNWSDDDCDGEIDEGHWGMLIEPVGITDGTRETRNPLISFGIDSYVIAWEDERNGTPGELYTKEVGLHGENISQDIRLIGNGSSERLGDITWGGDRYAIAYYSEIDSGDYEVWVATVRSDGSRIREVKSIYAMNDQTFPSITYDGTGWALAWFDERTTEGWHNVYFARIEPENLVLSGVASPLSISMQEETIPDVAWSGSGYAVVWKQLSQAGWLLNLKTISSDGTPSGTIKTVSGIFTYLLEPTIVWTGSEWVVSWAGEKSDGTKGYFLARLDESGDLISGSETTVDTFNSIPQGNYAAIRIAAAELGLGVVWEKDVTPGRRDILFRRFTYDLNPIGEILPIDTEGTSHTPAIAWDGEGFGIVWLHRTLESGLSAAVGFVRVGCLTDS